MNLPLALKQALFDSLAGFSALTSSNTPDCFQACHSWTPGEVQNQQEECRPTVPACMHTALKLAAVLTAKAVTHFYTF